MSLLDWIFPAKPFEFGGVESRDRILANALLARAGQGSLLTDTSAARPILRIGPQEIVGSKVARAAFVELTRFSGHLIVGFGGVHHGRQDGSIRAGV